MEKQALVTDWGTVGRFGAGGLVTGASTAALLNLVHLLRQQRHEQKDKSMESETDKDTIVLNLPAKGASVLAKFAFELKEESTVSSDVMHDHVKPGFRHKPGRRDGGRWTNPIGKRKVKVNVDTKPIEEKSNGPADYNRADVSEPEVTKAATGWPTLTMSALAAMGGTGAGVALVDKLYQMRREKLLKKELEAAQNDYTTALYAPQKMAAINDLFPIAEEKQADTTHTFGMLNYPIAAAALLTLMGTGGTAYITKRILDEKLRESREKGLDLPKVKRIVFRTQPAVEEEQVPEGMKLASENDMTNIKAAFFIVVDKLSPHTTILNDPQVKVAQAAAGVTTPGLFNLSEGDIGSTMAFLDSHPDLASKIVRAGMARRPIMKHFQWAANTGIGRSLGKHKIRDFLTSLKGPSMQPQPKLAGAMDMAAAMLVGKTLGGGTEDATKALLENTGKRPVEEAVDVNDAGTPKIDLSKVRVDAADPQAAAYVKANKQKIIQILQSLADEGKI